MTIDAVKKTSVSGSLREESNTTIFCQQCYNKSWWQEEINHEFVEKKAHRGRLSRMLGKDQYIREMWHILAAKD